MTDAPGENPTDLDGAVASVLARLRKAQGWTLDDLADRSGLHRTTLGLVERGERGMSLASAHAVAAALDMPLSGLVALAENVRNGIPEELAVRSPRRIPAAALRNDAGLQDLCGLRANAIQHAIEYAYDTFDLIDSELLARGSEPIAGLVELANLSSMIGNLVGAGIAEASTGFYVRNRPHAFPDLIPQRTGLPELEIKTALETNSPKGHLPKAGAYLTFRYVLGTADGQYVRGKAGRGKTVWLWEVRAGYLEIDDFSFSSTDGDSGKTAVVRGPSLKAMHLVLRDDRFMPYARPWGV